MCSPLKVFLLIVSLKATLDNWWSRFWFRSVQFFSRVCCTRSMRCVAHRWDDLRGMMHTAVWCTPLRWSPRYDAHRWDDLRSMLHTPVIVSVVCTEIISAVRNGLQRLSPWRASPRYVAHSADNLCFVLHTAEIVSAVCCTPLRQLCDRISRRNQNRIRK